MLWLVRVEKVPQASEHLCPAKLQTKVEAPKWTTRVRYCLTKTFSSVDQEHNSEAAHFLTELDLTTYLLHLPTAIKNVTMAFDTNKIFLFFSYFLHGCWNVQATCKAYCKDGPVNTILHTATQIATLRNCRSNKLSHPMQSDTGQTSPSTDLQRPGV